MEGPTYIGNILSSWWPYWERGINRVGDVGKRGWKFWGRERHESSEENTSQREGNTIRILEKRLCCLVATLTELKAKELGAKVTLNLLQWPEETLHERLIMG